jgi:hypothetical protein
MGSNLTGKFFILLMGVAIGSQQIISQSNLDRSPAAKPQPLELHLQQLSLDSTSRVEKLDKIFIRLTLNKSTTLEFGRDETWSLSSGESRRIDLKVDVKPEWIQKDQLEFKVEIVKSGFLEQTIVRCSTVSKSVSTYNRSYQCLIPGDSAPLLTYRLATKGSPVPGANHLASAHNH